MLRKQHDFFPGQRRVRRPTSVYASSVHGLKRILQQVGASDIVIEAQKVHALQCDFVWPAVHAKHQEI